MARIETALSPTTEDEDSPARRLTLGLPNARFSDLGASAGASTPQSPAWPDQLSEQYDIQRVLGRGASSQVFAATHKSTGEKRAVKRIYKPKCCRTARATRRLRDEVRVLSSIRHRHIVEMREVFETPSELFVVMERCEGGELCSLEFDGDASVQVPCRGVPRPSRLRVKITSKIRQKYRSTC